MRPGWGVGKGKGGGVEAGSAGRWLSIACMYRVPTALGKQRTIINAPPPPPLYKICMGRHVALNWEI